MDRIVRWIHVSDWHVKAPLDRNIRDVLDALIVDVGGMVSPPAGGAHPFSPDFVAHTGDLAFSGRAPEYTAAVPFLQRLMEKAKLPMKRLYVVPGNHDVNDEVAVPAESLLSANDEHLYTESGREWYDSTERRQMLLKRFDNFHAASASIVPPGQRSDGETPYYACRIETASGAFVGILGLNGSERESVSEPVFMRLS